MSVEKPPRLPREPRRPGSRPGAQTSTGSSAESVNLQAWSQLARAKSQFEDGLAAEAGDTARAVLDDLPSSHGQEEFALQGTAATILGLSLAAQQESQAQGWLELAASAFAQAPDWTASRKDLAADWALALAGLGEFADAIPLLEDVMTDPREATPLVRRTLADALASVGLLDDAIEVLTQTVLLAPNDGEAHLRLAQLLDEAAYPSERQVAAWTTAGETLLAAGAVDQAVDAVERAVQLEPTPTNLDLLGRAYTWIGDYAGAVSAFRESDRLAPSAAVRINLADALAELGSEDEAVQAAVAALELRSDDVDLLASAAAHLLAANRLDELELAIEQLAVVDSARAAGYRGIVAYRRDDPSLASTELGAAMYVPPDDPVLLWAMAEVLSYLLQSDLVVKALDRLLELDPGRGEALAQRGVAQIGRGNVEEGEADLRASLLVVSYPEVNAYLGDLLVSTGRFEEGAAQLSQAIIEGFDESWVLVSHGQALKGLRRDEEAEQAFREVFERDRADLDAIIGLASVLLDKFSMSSDAEAEEVIEHGLTVAPESATLLALHGEVLRRDRRLDEAVVYFERALAAIPDWPWALGSLAQTLRERSDATGELADLERAKELLESALPAAPDEPFLHSELAEVAARQDNLRKAHDHLKKAFALDEAEVGYLVRRGELYLDSGEPLRAKGCFERALAIRPNHPGLRTQLANLLAGQHDLTAAFALLDEALAVDPDDGDARHARFTLRWNSDRWSEAVEDLDHLQVLWPDMIDLVARRGDVYRLQGRFDEAIELLDRLLLEVPEQDTALMVRGAVYLARGRTEEARADLERAVVLAPDEPFASSQLEDVRIAMGEGEQALAEIEERRKTEDSPELELNYAGLLNRCGRPDEAVQILEEGLWEKLEDPGWLAMLGWALVACKRYEEGIGYLGRAADLQPDRDAATPGSVGGRARGGTRSGARLGGQGDRDPRRRAWWLDRSQPDPVRVW